ncbi:lipoate--protein ligase family protein [Candidatus Palauibacter sp.]|uniref:lipoate--protein ligase family protein n=1 Tax=Candidatus Palauibacter sp. TaxID=3101350 RepID=UPI003B014297
MTVRGVTPPPGGPPCVVLPYAVADGARNMALDEAMLEYAGGGRTLLRFYGWEPWCVSLGRNQPAPARLLGKPPGDIRPGVDAVRRPTGGRSVFHGPEITYAFACPDRAWGGPKAVLRTLHRALADGLRALGVPVDDLPRGDAPPTGTAGPIVLSTAACFVEPAPGELTVGGRKLVGSAQRRRCGALLQHGSILLEDRQTLADLEGPGAATNPAGAPLHRPAIGLREALSPAPDAGTIVRCLEAGLAREFGAAAALGSAAAASAALDRMAAAYESAHRSAARLWGREHGAAAIARRRRLAGTGGRA